MPNEYLLLCLAAAAGGAINSIAGGGTLLTFPALYALLGDTPDAPRIANYTSTVALFPAAVAAAGGYRRELADSRAWLGLLGVPSLVGGLLGALLVVWLPGKSFEHLVPWLILVAASLFALQPLIARTIGIGQPHAPPTGPTTVGVAAFQFLVGVYGGYFGAGIGILMLSALALLGLSDVHAMNALKSVLGACINGVAVFVFAFTGQIDWPLALAMAVAGIVGGYLGARVARKLNRNFVRGMVVVIGFSLAALYFYRQATPRKAEPAPESMPSDSK